MVRLIAICGMSLVLIGCFGRETIDINTHVIEQKVEILYCPAPPEITRPELPIHQMTPVQEQNDGEVVKHWKATVLLLMGYTKELETIVDKQKEINKVYEDKKKADEEKPVAPTE